MKPTRKQLLIVAVLAGGVALAAVLVTRYLANGDAAELAHAGHEADLGAQRRLVEDQRDSGGTGERACAGAVRLEPERGVEHLGLLRGAEVVVAQEVSGHGVPPS